MKKTISVLAIILLSANPSFGQRVFIDGTGTKFFVKDDYSNTIIELRGYSTWADFFYEGLLNVKSDDNKRCGFIDKSTNIVIPCKYVSASPFSEGLALVSSGAMRSYGFIDKSGNVVIPIKYNDAYSFSEGLAAVELNGKWGFIDKSGDLVVPCKYDYVLSFSEGLAAVKLNGEWGFIDKSGNIVIPCKYDLVDSFSEGLAAVELNGKLDFIDKSGNIVIPCKYDLVDSFSEGLAAVKLNGKWGFIDKSGNIVIPCKYDLVDSFSEGLAAVKLNEKLGFIDKSGNIVIPCKYDWFADSEHKFENKLFYVRINREAGYIDHSGTWYNVEEVNFQTYSFYAKGYITPKVNAWQKKGEFETSTSYKSRVNEQSRNALVAKLAKEAEKAFIAQVRSRYTNDFQIGSYDADNESFLFTSPTQGKFVIKVPLIEARAFKTNYKIDSQNPTWAIVENQARIVSLAAISNGKRYKSADVAYSQTKVDLNFAPLDLNLSTTTADYKLQNKPTIVEQTIKIGRSDVDINIPITTTSNSNTFVLIIANQDYQNEKSISTAKNDGQMVRMYCQRTLGIPSSNIRYNENCTWKNIESAIDNFAYTMQVNPEAKFLIFYFGHGMVDPNKEIKDSYLLPIDGASTQIAKDGYSRNKMLQTFANQKPKQCLVFLESCFSGAAPDNTMLSYSINTSGMRFDDVVEPVNGNIVVMTASSAAQTANAYPEQGHNVFTYELLKLLKSTAGNISLGDLFFQVQINTSRTANNQLNGAKQTPTVIVNSELGTKWHDWKLK